MKVQNMTYSTFIVQSGFSQVIRNKHLIQEVAAICQGAAGRIRPAGRRLPTPVLIGHFKYS